jgi:hypothetical protein
MHAVELACLRGRALSLVLAHDASSAASVAREKIGSNVLSYEIERVHRYFTIEILLSRVLYYHKYYYTIYTSSS